MDESDDFSLARLHEVLASSSRLMLISALPKQRGGALCTDLLSLISERGRLSEEVAKPIFAKLVLAVKWAHESSVVLRNLKPEAVQLLRQTADSPWEVHIADLHCAAITEEGDEGTLTGEPSLRLHNERHSCPLLQVAARTCGWAPRTECACPCAPCAPVCR